MPPGAACWLLTLAWCLFVATEAEAQPREASTEREVVLPKDLRAEAPEIGVPARGTVIRFLDARIDPESVELEGQDTRVELFDKSSRTLVIVPRAGQDAAGRLRLEVAFADGEAPTRAVLTLVLGATRTDERVAVVRRASPAAVLEARLHEALTLLTAREAELHACLARAEAPDPAEFALQALLDSSGVQGQEVKTFGANGDGLRVVEAWTLRTARWALVSVDVENKGPAPWAPVEARLVRVTTGEGVRVLGLRMKVARVAPREVARVVVKTGAPAWLAGALFRLELRDAAGRGLLMQDVKL